MTTMSSSNGYSTQFMTMSLQLNLSSSPSANSPIGYHAIYFFKSTLSSSLSSPSANEPLVLHLISRHKNYADVKFLPSATWLRQGNVFTPVLHSVHVGVSVRHPRAATLPWPYPLPPRRPLQRTIRILLKCILVPLLTVSVVRH